MKLLVGLDNVNLFGHCVMGVFDILTQKVMWLSSVEYLDITAIKDIKPFNDYWIVIIETQDRISKICILSQQFEIVGIIYRKDFATIKTIYCHEDQILLGGKGVIISLKLNEFGQFSGCSQAYKFDPEFVCTSITYYQGRIVYSIFAENSYAAKIIDSRSTECLFEFTGNPRSLIVKDERLIFLDAHKSSIYTLKNLDISEVVINRGYLSLITEINNSFFLVANSWRRYSRHSHGARGNWDKMPQWMEGKSFLESHRCNLIELDDHLSPKSIYNLSHIADEISSLLVLPEIFIPDQPDGTGDRALYVKWKHEHEKSTMKRAMGQLKQQLDANNI